MIKNSHSASDRKLQLLEERMISKASSPPLFDSNSISNLMVKDQNHSNSCVITDLNTTPNANVNGENMDIISMASDSIRFISPTSKSNILEMTGLTGDTIILNNTDLSATKIRSNTNPLNLSFMVNSDNFSLDTKPEMNAHSNVAMEENHNHYLPKSILKSHSNESPTKVSSPYDSPKVEKVTEKELKFKSRQLQLNFKRSISDHEIPLPPQSHPTSKRLMENEQQSNSDVSQSRSPKQQRREEIDLTSSNGKSRNLDFEDRRILKYI
jgi:hypothetical protein